VCGLAGIQAPEQLKGRNLAPILRGKSMPESEVVFLMNVGAPDGSEGGAAENGGGLPPPEFRGLRSKTHTYAVAKDGRWILFDNEKDPYQLQNLIDDPKQKPLVDHFNHLIAERCRRSLRLCRVAYEAFGACSGLDISSKPKENAVSATNAIGTPRILWRKHHAHCALSVFLWISKA
jgi:arylsulfatase A-like enzyme